MHSGFRSAHFSSKGSIYRFKHIKVAFKWPCSSRLSLSKYDSKVIYSVTYLSGYLKGHLCIRANLK